MSRRLHELSPGRTVPKRSNKHHRRSAARPPTSAARHVAWAALLWAVAAPLSAQTLAAGASAAAPAPCRSARAVYDTSCPNYTGFAHPLETGLAPSAESGTGLRAAAPGLGAADSSANAPRLKLGPVLDRGLASWYGDRHHGARTASGEAFSKHALTAAHKTLPFGTRVLVRSLSTGREVVVRITDRGPRARNRVIDLSKAAAEALGIVARGHDTVVVHALAPSAEDEPVATTVMPAAGDGF